MNQMFSRGLRLLVEGKMCFQLLHILESMPQDVYLCVVLLLVAHFILIIILLICSLVPHVRVDRPVTPKVLVLLPTGAQMQRSERVTLACVITGLRSKTVRITWKVNEATGLKKHASSPQVQREPGGTFSAVGLYTVLAHKRENMYRCEVTYKGPFYYDKVESSLCRPL